jgi:hypothetical protein
MLKRDTQFEENRLKVWKKINRSKIQCFNPCNSLCSNFEHAAILWHGTSLFRPGEDHVSTLLRIFHCESHANIFVPLTTTPH